MTCQSRARNGLRETTTGARAQERERDRGESVFASEISRLNVTAVLFFSQIKEGYPLIFLVLLFFQADLD